MKSLFSLDQDLTEKQAKIFFVVFILALGLVGNLEFDDEIEAAAHYKNLVCYGEIPDYKQLKPEC